MRSIASERALQGELYIFAFFILILLFEPPFNISLKRQELILYT